MHHRQPPGLEQKMRREGKVYCPWREGYVALPPALDLEGVAKRLNALPLLRHPLPALREWQGDFLSNWLSTNDSFALQAEPGRGKTRAALFAAALVIAQGGRVVYAVQTKDHLDQAKGEIAALFKSPFGDDISDFTAFMGGHSGRAKRKLVYDDVKKSLIVVLAASLARDVRSVDEAQGKRPKKSTSDTDTEGVQPVTPPAFDFSSCQLLILDEGDLMRGDEPLARIHRAWKAHQQRPRLLIQSATLTVTQNPSPEHWEVVDYLEKMQVGHFFNVPSPPSLNYEIAQPTRFRLPQEVCIASAQIRAEFWDVLHGIKERELEACNDLDSPVQQKIAALLKKKCSEPNYREYSEWRDTRHSHLLPSVKSVLSLISCLKLLQEDTAESGSGRAIGFCLRDAFKALVLFHCNELLTNEPRVSFLEYVGQNIHAVRTGTEMKPHLRDLFVPGKLPPWWIPMAKGTPYENLSGIDAETFFRSDRSLGRAARSLLDCRFAEHGNVQAALDWLQGGIRRKSPCQAMVACGTAVETMYLREILGKRTGETSVSLMGHGHSSPFERQAAFQLAHSGEASLVTATSVVERGVHLEDHDQLIVLKPPYEPRQARQLLGRVGRNERKAGLVVFAFAEGSSREAMSRALSAKCAAFGDSDPLKLSLQKYLGRRRRGSEGLSLFS